MKSFIGIGKGAASNAIVEATRGLSAPKLIVFIAPYDAMQTAASYLREQYPNAESIGTLGTSLANGSVSDNQIVVTAFFDDTAVCAGVLEQISECPVAEIGSLEQRISIVKPNREDTVCIEFCTGEEEKLVTTLNAVLGRKGIQLAGGTVFGVPDGKEAVVAYNGALYKDACAYALIRNTTGKVKVFKENIYQKRADAEAHFATKVDTHNKTVLEFDGRPAAEVYSHEIGISKDKIIDNVLINPMGRAVGDQVFIASMKELTPQGGFLNYKRINKNDCMYFLELADYDSVERSTRESIKQEMRSVSLVFSIDCIYRYLFYDSEGYFGTYAKNMASLGSHVGVVGGGEQFNNQHVNQTMVCAVFE